jgi:hypothetical protein
MTRALRRRSDSTAHSIAASLRDPGGTVTHLRVPGGHEGGAR